MEKADLEAQERTEINKCPRCFSAVQVGLATCPECGIQLSDVGLDKVNEAVEPELAKANLNRLRGDFATARGQLLAILRRYPNHAGAHELLGDVCEEQDDLEQAAQWYELALDLDPAAPGLAGKHADIIFQLAKREQEAVHDQIGLGSNHRTWLSFAILGLVCFLALLATLAFIRRDVKPQVVTSTFVAKPSATPTAEPSPTPSASATPTPTAVPSPGSLSTKTDSASLQLLQRTAGGETALGLISDPRGGSWIISFRLIKEDDPKVVAAELARAGFDLFPGCSSMVLRGMIDNEVVYESDSARASYVETKTDAWKQANPKPDAWIDALIKNEWRPAK